MDAITRPAVTIDRAGRHSSAPLDVRQITAEQHQAFVAGRPSVSFLQVPQWAAAKPDWASESVGWISVDGRIVGAALVLYRRIPRLNRSLAYLPEGPVIDWGAPDLSRWLEPLVEHLRARGAFTVRIGPPVQRRWWETPTIRSAIAGGSAVRLGDVAPDGVGASAADVTSQLRAMGWRQAPGYRDTDGDGRHGSGAGFAGGQPRYVFQVPIGGRSITEVFAGLGQQWRRNIRTSERLDVVVTAGGRDDFDVFHDLYVTTAARDGFTPRPRPYFPQMWDALHADFSPAVAARPSRFTTVRGGREAGGAAGDTNGGAAGNPMGDTASGAAGDTNGGAAGNPMGDTASGAAGNTNGGAAGNTNGGAAGDTSDGAARDLVAASDRTSTGGSVGISVGAPADAPAGGPGRPDMRLYLARHRGAVLAASILVRVGDHAWYSYGASADHDRRLKPSNALQWRMLADAHAAGAAVYDLRGIGASLDADDALFGLTRFKLGSGGRAVELLGEWELPINRLLHRAVGAYLARR
jgi:lipid II:glycine glycyltransferase (peptidoglycan interpeptide bridge formation enzyme)